MTQGKIASLSHGLRFPLQPIGYLKSRFGRERSAKPTTGYRFPFGAMWMLIKGTRRLDFYTRSGFFDIGGGASRGLRVS